MSNAAKIGLAVGGCVALAGLGAVAFMFYGLHLYDGEVCARVRRSPAIVTRLGAPSSCARRWSESGEIDDDSTFAFDVAGPKGKGRVYVQSTSTGPNGEEEYQGILLVVGAEEVLVEGKRPPVPAQGRMQLP